MASKELCTIQGRTERILNIYPDTRSNDRKLIKLYFQKYHGVTTFMQYCENPKLPTIESIRRCRQKIQADGRCLAVESVADARAEKEVEYADHFGN